MRNNVVNRYIVMVFQDDTRKLILLGMMAVIFILIMAISGAIYMHSRVSKAETAQKETQKQLETLTQHQATSQDSGPRGAAGERGPPGPEGKAGGPYQASGPLRNLQSNGAYVMDRLHGSGIASIAYLNKLNYQPNQIWTLMGSGEIQNKYGQCLEGDKISGNVYMAGCDPNSTKQKWRHNNYGQISSLDTNNQECLDVTLESQFDGANQIEQGSRLKSGNSHYNLRRVKLKACDRSNNLSSSQQWVFV